LNLARAMFSVELFIPGNLERQRLFQVHQSPMHPTGSMFLMWRESIRELLNQML